MASNLTKKEFDKQYGDLITHIQKQSTPFSNDTTAKKLARKKRAQVDKFFFAAVYFPHYIMMPDEFKDCWKDPDAKIDWMQAGFAPFHKELFAIPDELNKFSIIAGFRESAKDTLIGKIDILHKLVFEDRWFIPVIAKTESKAETKVVPIKIELEENTRLKNDFGDLKGTSEWEYGSFVTSTGRKMKGYGRDQSLRGEEYNSHRPDLIQINDINDPLIPDSLEVIRTVVERIKKSILYSVNSTRWSVVMLCNWTVKGDIVDELITGKNTSHYDKHIFRSLVDNPLETKEQKAIAKQCRDAGFLDNKISSWEFRHPTLKLLRDQKNDPDTFNSEMQMIPRPRKDQKFKDTYFHFHAKEQLVGRTYVSYTFVDPSIKDAGDYKAIISVSCGVLPSGQLHIPVRRAWIQQSSVDEMIRETYRHRRAFNSKLIGVETNGFQLLLKPEYLRLQASEKALLPFHEMPHHGESKTSRIERLIPFVKEGIITFDTDDPDQELLIQQLKVFPNAGQVSAGGLGDDGPDALAGCIELIEEFPHSGEIEYKSLKKREAIFDRGTW